MFDLQVEFRKSPHQMTLAPITPAVLKELIVQPEDSLRESFRKTYIRGAVQIYKVIRWAFNADGSATTDLKNWVCEGCEAAKLKATATTSTVSATATAEVNA